MDDIQKALAGFLSDKSIAIHADNLQVLSVPLVWNWPVSTLGQIPEQQFLFCDTMPAKPDSQYFTSGGDSYSENYHDFLQLLNPSTFQPISLLNEAIKNNTPPTSISDPAPDGWTTVLDQAGVKRWRRIWTVSQSPSQWLQSISTTTNKNEPLTLVFQPDDIAVNTSSGTVNISKDQIVKVTLTAQAYGMITVTPGAWCNDTVLQIAKLDTNSFLSPVLAKTVFGTQGTLAAHISSFFVAYMPSAVVEISTEATQQSELMSSAIQSVQVAGIEYENVNTTTGVGKGGTGFAPSQTLTLNASVNQTMARGLDSNNQAYIIAVTLMRNEM